jgi:hypothetical protein
MKDMKDLKEQIAYSVVSQILKDTEDTIVEKDVNSAAFSIGEDALNIISHPEQSNTYQLIPFTIVGTGKDSTEALLRLLDVETKFCFKLLLNTAISNITNKITIIRENEFKESLSDIQLQVEKHRYLVDKFIINKSEIELFKRNINAIDYEPVTRDRLQSGVYASLWGLDIYCVTGESEPGKETVAVPKGVIFAVADGRYLGKKKIFDLNMYEADDKCTIICKMGMTIHNPRAVAIGSTLKNLDISLKQNLI